MLTSRLAAHHPAAHACCNGSVPGRARHSAARRARAGGLLPMYLGLYLHADALLKPLLTVYRGLPSEEQTRVEILTNSFGDTGSSDTANGLR